MSVRWWWMGALVLGLAVGARAETETAPSGPDQPEAAAAASAIRLQIRDETLPVVVVDGLLTASSVTLRMPRALHRDANAFRLYGPRPLTLRSRQRRRDLYRDAFLELATRSRLAQSTSIWEPLNKQVEWVAAQSPAILRTLRDQGVVTATGQTTQVVSGSLLPALQRQFSTLRQRTHTQVLTQALQALPGTPDAVEPIREALLLRALATDEAEQRLLQMGALLRLDQPSADPALREGYQAARQEFEQLRESLWSALGSTMKKHQGKLLVSAVRQLVLSQLGGWAIFGYVAWQGVESAVSADYRGQYAVILATVATHLADRVEAGERRDEAPGRVARGNPRSLALYAEYAVNYQLTEALKSGQVLTLKPAGGLSVAAWQIRCYGRCEELKQALAEG